MPSRPTATTRRRGRPSAQETQEITGHILTIAKNCFLELGYEATSIDEIVDRAGISNQTFYNRFSNKASLFEEILRKFADSLLEERRRVDSDLLNLPIDEALLKFSVRVLQQISNPELLALERLLLSTLKQYPENAAIVVSAGDALTEMVETLLIGAEVRGEIKVENRRRSSRWFIDGAIGPRMKRSSLGLAQLNLTDTDLDDIEAYVGFYLRGLCCKVPKAV
ncbi:TetR/AcrR family transcriptional regulator [Aureimonas sp. SK2]|uniref:TetR/AcrR family transcriptional regulator n=1 Tax=Aureimonas sp. SK2 TaxID=3015992 RepID=UPI002444F614|nr:TetR/AcrR family transcriptional regulator [Aureimonas sp. SK2]